MARTAFLLGLTLAALLTSSCGGAIAPTAAPTAVPTALSPAIPPTAAPAPSATTQERPTLATATPMSTPLPPTPTTSPVPPATPVPPALATALPNGAEPLYDLAWPENNGCGKNITAIPYRLPGGGLSLATVNLEQGQYTRSWDWQQEEVTPTRWVEIHPMLATNTQQNALVFLGLDETGQWWAGIVEDFCHTPFLKGTLPVSNPEHVFLALYPDYWVLEHGKLILYRLIDRRAVQSWSWEQVRGEMFSPQFWDVTNDGQEELVLIWGWTPAARDAGIHTPGGPWQIFKPEGQGYRLIGEFAPGFQFADTDRDGLVEVLWPWPADNPTIWKRCEWNGERFEWQEPLPRPVAPRPTIPDLQSLPTLPIGISFLRSNEIWTWPREGGPLRPPSPTGAPVRLVDSRSLVVGPTDCPYSLVTIPAQIEGSSYGLSFGDTGQVMQIPDTFAYVEGHSTFAWDPQCRFLIHARSDGAGALYRIDVPTGTVQILLSLSNEAVGPIVMPDQSIGFTVQGWDPALYPPLGVYKITRDNNLVLLADIPPLETLDYPEVSYGVIAWSPDAELFLYYAPLSGRETPPYRTLLLGKTDGTAVWDLTSVLGNAIAFQWDP